MVLGKTTLKSLCLLVATWGAPWDRNGKIPDGHRGIRFSLQVQCIFKAFVSEPVFLGHAEWYHRYMISEDHLFKDVVHVHLPAYTVQSQGIPGSCNIANHRLTKTSSPADEICMKRVLPAGQPAHSPFVKGYLVFFILKDDLLPGIQPAANKTDHRKGKNQPVHFWPGSVKYT